MRRTVIISLGGSLIVPQPGYIDVKFMKKFRTEIINFVARNDNRVIIVSGGGRLNKRYNSAIQEIVKPSLIDLDWLGISATKLHAEFVRIMFGQKAHQQIIDNPTKKINTDKQILCGGGWRPGCSTDKDSVLLAKTYGSHEVINLTNIDYVYTKDPRKFKNAKKVKDTTWTEYFKMIPKKWSPRLNTPFGPPASRLAKKYGVTVSIINGKKVSNLKKVLLRKTFKGTTIYP
ncbi:UMP kinase [Patescibacteria group bacterium]|nr:UMP kinase [Patescibacteria group bacterium]MBU1890280.1 UMP kinase [Patescibacteria group bacterium]